VKGEVTMYFNDDVFDRVDADYLILKVDGIFVPFFMEEYRFRSDANAIVKFENIDTQERAKELTGCEVYFPLELVDSDSNSISWAAIVVFDIIDATTGQPVGRIASIDDSTINILFELEDGKLIPASEELITDVNKDNRTITIDLPQGILDI
jgi:16S rRNA processing protein RimM